MGLFEFFNQHEFLAWCALWLVWPAVYICGVFLQFIFNVINRTLRTLKVIFRGWPPEHLDADGDWQPHTSGDN